MRFFNGTAALLCPGILVLLTASASCQDTESVSLSNSTEGWKSGGPRNEILPTFEFDPAGGPSKKGSLRIKSDHRDGLHGWWETTGSVDGGHWYRFHAACKVAGAECPRRAAVARIFWQDETGGAARHDFEATTTFREGERPSAEPEYPSDGPALADGWYEVAGQYRLPANATKARIELSFRWPANATVEWSDVTLSRIPAPSPRTARLAAVHYCPAEGTTSAEKCEQFAPLIAQAAEQKADLVVLPETLTYYGSNRTYAECAETIPGPSTEYFGKLAAQHNLYLVVGLLERDEHRIFNVAVLIGPDGEVQGKYRKVTLPRGEIDGGVMPGNDFPVFETRFGKVGMMVCYDGFYPEVARELSNRGAEVIAFPVWGCNPLLASARACENHAFVVSSTYCDRSMNWMTTSIFGRDGRPLKTAENWGDVIVTEVDLSQPTIWHSLGDFRAEVQRHRPMVKPLIP